jgi:hypothetical protein
MVVNGSIHAFEFVQYSDERLKSDIQRISNALELVSQLRGSKYVWKHNERKAYGLIAQEVQRVVPEVVHKNEQGLLSVNYIELIPILINALNQQAQQQRADTTNIRAELTQLNEQLLQMKVYSQLSTSYLPNEIIAKIFFFADWKTLLRCCSVSRMWQDTLACQNSLWQRVIEVDWLVELVQKPESLTWYKLATKLAKVPKIGFPCQGEKKGQVVALAFATEYWIEADESNASMWASHYNIFPEVFDEQDVAGVTCSFVPGSLVFWQADPTKPQFKSASLINIARATNTAVVQYKGSNKTTTLDRLRVRVDETVRRKFLQQVVAFGCDNSRVMLETELLESGLFWSRSTTLFMPAVLKQSRHKIGGIDIGVRFEDGVEKWVPKSYETFTRE